MTAKEFQEILSKNNKSILDRLDAIEKNIDKINSNIKVMKKPTMKKELGL